MLKLKTIVFVIALALAQAISGFASAPSVWASEDSGGGGGGGGGDSGSDGRTDRRPTNTEKDDAPSGFTPRSRNLRAPMTVTPQMMQMAFTMTKIFGPPPLAPVTPAMVKAWYDAGVAKMGPPQSTTWAKTPPAVRNNIYTQMANKINSMALRPPPKPPGPVVPPGPAPVVPVGPAPVGPAPVGPAPVGPGAVTDSDNPENLPPTGQDILTTALPESVITVPDAPKVDPTLTQSAPATETTVLSEEDLLGLQSIVAEYSEDKNLEDAPDVIDQALDYAELSNNTYVGEPTAGYNQVEDLKDPYTGFHGEIVYSPSKNEVVVVLEGTDPTHLTGDMMTNAGQGVGAIPDQYVIAVAFVDRGVAYAEANGASVTVTGHSLGGGLATYAGLKNGVPVFAFNPASMGPGLALDVLNTVGFDNANVTNIRTDADPVSDPRAGIGGIVAGEVGAIRPGTTYSFAMDTSQYSSQHSMDTVVGSLRAMSEANAAAAASQSLGIEGGAMTTPVQ